MEGLLVSVIIPVYNVAPFLRQCLDSIINQTYQNIEILLVDDGSTDDSGKICDEYAKNDARIQVIHKKNGGQATARNDAIKVAQGEYVIYIDGDDYIGHTHIQSLIQAAEKYDADFVQCEMEKFYNNFNVLKVYPLNKEMCKTQIYSASDALKEFSYQGKFTPSPVCKLIKKDLMAGLEFPVGVGYEDMAVVYKVIGRAHRIVYISEISYYYRQHNGSTMHTKFSDKKVDRIRIAKLFLNYVKENYPEVVISAYTRYSLAQLQLLMELPFGKKYRNLRNIAFHNLKESRTIVLHDKEAPTRLKVMIGASYLGPVILILLGKAYAKMVRR